MNPTQAASFDVLCAGSIVQDTIVRPVDDLRWGTTTFVESMDRFVGGNGANTASAFSVLGNRVRLLGAIGADDGGRFVRAELARLGVDTEAITASAQSNAATTVLVNSAGDRQFLHRLGSSRDAFCEPVDFTEALVAGARHFHMASFFVLPHLRNSGAEILRRARAARLSTSVDVNWDPHNEWIEALAPAMPHIDIFFVNEDEARMLTGTSNLREAANKFHSCGVHTVVQKLGSNGCVISTAGDRARIHCDAFHVDCVDTTGAGDCFAAGFLTAFLRKSSLHDCGEWANAAGAQSVSRIGAVTGLLPCSEFAQWRLQTPKRASARR